MIRCNLAELLRERGWSVRSFHRRSRISPNTIRDLAHNRTTRVEFGVLDRLCSTLGVQPGQVLQWVRGAEPRRPKPRARRAAQTPPRPCGHVSPSSTCYDCLYPEDTRSDGPDPTVYRVAEPEPE